MNRAIAVFGTVMLLATFASSVEAQSSPIGSAADLQGLQERAIEKGDPFLQSDSTSPIVTPPSRDNQATVQLDQNLQLQIRPERSTSQSGVYPVDDTSKGNQVQLLYQIEP